MNKDKQIKSIVAEIFEIPSPKIDESYRNQIYDFIKTTINGDSDIKYYLAIDVIINQKDGVVIYVLTDKRLIQFEIDADGEIKSGSLILKQIIGGIVRSLSENGTKMEVILRSHPDVTAGLKYDIKNDKITKFFEEVEQVLLESKQNG